ncbi:MAG: hypothetical protein KME64_20980 [Scytonematopsis contorta HA4267-MV1]|nr:hypothetical protein [Scytonematopsis contorta HA4267-MV1]
MVFAFIVFAQCDHKGLLLIISIMKYNKLSTISNSQFPTPHSPLPTPMLSAM